MLYSVRGCSEGLNALLELELLLRHFVSALEEIHQLPTSRSFDYHSFVKSVRDITTALYNRRMQKRDQRLNIVLVEICVHLAQFSKNISNDGSAMEECLVVDFVGYLVFSAHYAEELAAAVLELSLVVDVASQTMKTTYIHYAPIGIMDRLEITRTS